MSQENKSQKDLYNKLRAERARQVDDIVENWDPKAGWARFQAGRERFREEEEREDDPQEEDVVETDMPMLVVPVYSAAKPRRRRRLRKYIYRTAAILLVLVTIGVSGCNIKYHKLVAEDHRKFEKPLSAKEYAEAKKELEIQKYLESRPFWERWSYAWTRVTRPYARDFAIFYGQDPDMAWRMKAKQGDTAAINYVRWLDSTANIPRRAGDPSGH